MRGKASCHVHLTLVSRITPAYAGKRALSSSPRVALKDHPRMCGEKTGFIAHRMIDKGSPPHVRGKDDNKPLTKAKKRITPACAGKRNPGGLYLSSVWDHPRMCGEKAAFTFDFPKELGSPPRMRGKAMLICIFGVLLRITPACAGKRNFVVVCSSFAGDHPRVCGEKDSSPSSSK